MTRRATILLQGLTAFCLLISAAAFAGEQDRSIHCAVYSEAPWHFGGASDRQGVSDYYANLFSKASGYEIVLHPMPYRRSIRSVLTEDIDFVIALSSPELEEYALPYIQIGRIAVLIYSHQPMDVLFERPVDEVEVALMSGLTGNTDFDLPDWNVVNTNSEASALRAVAKGRMDATMVSRNTYEYLLEQEPDLAKGYIKDVGFANIYAWLSKEDVDKQPFSDARGVIEKHAFGGQLVFDWYTVSLPVIPDHY